MSAPTFVVGTGRCGSTMLSNMLREHPKVLSLSEFFVTVSEGSRLPECFSPTPIDGGRFWAIVSSIAPMLSFVLKHRIRYDECIYPCDDPQARYSRETGVPAISATTLPHLTADHDRLFDVLRDEVTRWPDAPIARHYRHLFDWLTRHFGKQLWIERSGTSLTMMESYLSMFPGARFIQILRDGRDTALSMQQHTGMRIYHAMNWLGQYLGVDPLTSSDRSQIDRVPPELRPILPEQFDIEAFNAYEVSLPLCGEIWSQQIEIGQQVLSTLSTDRLLSVRYEDIIGAPKQGLDALAAFLGNDFVDEAWSTRCVANVRKPRSTWRDLPEEEARALTEACWPGFEQLRAAGVHYDV